MSVAGLSDGPASAAELAADEAAERAARGEIAFEDHVERPIALEPRPRTLLIVDRRESERGRPLHRVGWAIVALVVGWLAYVGTGVLDDLGVMTAAFAVLVVGLILVRRGRPVVETREVPLLWMNSSLRVLRLRESAEQADLMQSSTIPFEEVREVLYATRNVPLPGDAGGASVDAAAVFLRLWDGTVWPVISSTLAKGPAFAVATGVAIRLNVGVKQVGAGWSARE
ncbi:MAG: hypothetical protein H6698_01555 [Myxococcales bacterium]|nr:hypothetical protein [Myxococcales bacterium]MCB9532996.1 hypothetical protein [Myxococcales bacterium]